MTMPSQRLTEHCIDHGPYDEAEAVELVRRWAQEEAIT